MWQSSPTVAKIRIDATKKLTLGNDKAQSIKMEKRNKLPLTVALFP